MTNNYYQKQRKTLKNVKLFLKKEKTKAKKRPKKDIKI